MRRLFTAAVVMLALAAGVGLAPPTAGAAEYPGGRRIYSVALGSVPEDGKTGGPAWVRLAMYYFFADGTVRESFWFFNRSTAIGAADTGVRSAGCDNCAVRTAAGFQPGSAAKTLDGTYDNAGDTVTITWSGGLTETWRISEPATDLARLDLAGSNYGARVGWGFGSNAANDVFTPVREIPRHPYEGRYESIGSNGIGDSGPSTMNMQNFTVCNDNCLSSLSEPTTRCAACPNGAPSSPIRYYLAGTGRRNFYEHWCTCLTEARCYTGGSHRKPQLQVIGDTGTFHGWVGVEASNSAANSGFFAVHFHVDV